MVIRKDRAEKKEQKYDAPSFQVDEVHRMTYRETTNMDPAKSKEIFESLANEESPDGPTKIFTTNDMDEAMKVAMAITMYHGECEIDKNDSTGEIKVFSYGKGMGRITKES